MIGHSAYQLLCLGEGLSIENAATHQWRRGIEGEFAASGIGELDAASEWTARVNELGTGGGKPCPPARWTSSVGGVNPEVNTTNFFVPALLNISDRADIETAALLLLVSAAVTEVALWGRREQARASKEQGYLAGVLSTAATVAAGRSSTGALTGAPSSC